VSLGVCEATSAAVIIRTETGVVCEGAIIQLMAAGDAASYRWRPAAGLSDPTARDPFVNSRRSGRYTVQLIDVNGEVIATESYDVSIVPPPFAEITPSGPTRFCDGETVLLQALQRPDYTYQWFFNGLQIAGETGPDFTASTTGQYLVEVSNGAC